MCKAISVVNKKYAAEYSFKLEHGLTDNMGVVIHRKGNRQKDT